MSGSRLWRYPAPAGRFLLRRWPSDGPGLVALLEIHGWVAAASDLDLLAVPIRGLDGRTVQQVGRDLWEVAPWLPGVAETAIPPDAGRARLAFEALGKVHARLGGLGDLGRSPGVDRRLAETTALIERGFARIDGELRILGDDEAVSLARRWLSSARVAAPAVRETLSVEAGRTIRRQPCFRDVRPSHFLFEGDRVSGLIDYGAMGRETVAADLARLGSEWFPGDEPGRNQAFAAYRTVRPLDARDLTMIAVFERSADVLLGGHWVRWHFVERRRFEDPSAVLTGLRRGVERVERLALSV